MYFQVKVEDSDGFIIRPMQASSGVAAVQRTKLLFPESIVKLKSVPKLPAYIPNGSK